LYSQALVVIHDKSYNNNLLYKKRFCLIGGKMSLRILIEDKYKTAIKSKNTNVVNTLRLVKSAIKDKDIAFRSGNDSNIIPDLEILSLLQILIKQRKDSIDAFKVASRDDLVANEQMEIDIISKFLPKQMNEVETENLIQQIIQKNNSNSLKDMGKIMNELKTNHSGSIDMALAGKIAKSKLAN
tara:strand:- start:11 stop:562 length:552 start_codon:yes stop_codon:yes gene_type:complete